MTTEHSTTNADLLLRIDGGQRHGETVSISSDKCILTVEPSLAKSPLQCAIFRGSHGAAVCSLGKEVLVNGSSSSVHWLQPGDRIQLPSDISATVEDLGRVASVSQRQQQQQERYQAALDALHRTMEEDLGPTPLDYKVASLVEAPVESKTADSKSANPAFVDDESEEIIVGYDCHQPATFSDPLPLESAVASAEELSAVPATPAPKNDATHTMDREVAEEPVLPEASTDLGEVQLETNPKVPSPVFTAEELQARLDALRPTAPVDPIVPPSSFPGQTREDLDPSVSALQPPAANESVDKSIDTLTHSSLVNGSSLDLPEQSDQQTDQGVSPTLDEQPGPIQQQPVVLEDQPVVQVDQPVVNEQPVEEVPQPSFQESESSHPEENFEDREVVATADLAEPELGEPEVEAEPAAPQPSVSDLLERMKAEGQWNGLPDDDGYEDQPVEIPEAPQQAQPEPAAVSEGDEDVEDYMARLLSRMRGDKPAEKKTEKKADTPSKKQPSAKVPEAKAQENFAPPANPLKAEDFVPQRKAQPIASLNAMRELANSTTRSAIQHSELSRRKSLGIAQVAIGVVSFLMSLYYFFIGSSGLFDIQFGIGVVCLLIAGFLAYRFYSTIAHNEKVDAEEQRLTAAKQALAAGAHRVAAK